MTINAPNTFESRIGGLPASGRTPDLSATFVEEQLGIVAPVSDVLAGAE